MFYHCVDNKYYSIDKFNKCSFNFNKYFKKLVGFEKKLLFFDCLLSACEIYVHCYNHQLHLVEIHGISEDQKV